jgi:hypothetical protein
MCDYSLETVDQRDARSNESLVTARIGEHKTIGLVSPGRPSTAVCLVSGTRARITASSSMVRDFHLPTDTVMATFTQRELPSDGVDYRDGFIFDDAPDMHHLLQEFDLGVTIVPMANDTAVVHKQERELVDA